jgi:hypothetical protein
VLSLFFQKQVRQELAGYVGHFIGAEVTFSDFSLSLLRNFPSMRMEISGIKAYDQGQEVLDVGRFTIIFSLTEIAVGTLDVKKIVIRDAKLTTITDEQGKRYRLSVLQDPGPGKKGKTLGLISQEVIIDNITVQSENRIKKNLTRVTVTHGRFMAGLNKPVTTITGEMKGTIDSLVSKGRLIFSELPVKAEDMVYIINSETGEQHVEQGSLSLANLKLVTVFSMKKDEQGQIIDLSLRSDNDLNAFLGLLNVKFGKDLEQVNPEAKATLVFREQGLVTPFVNPFMELEFSIADARIVSEKLPFPVTNLVIKGNYNNGEDHSWKTACIVIDTVHAEINESYIDGKLQVDNLQDPVITAQLTSGIDLGHIIKPGAGISADGRVTTRLDVKGRISDLEKSGLEGKELASGEINLSGLDLYLQDSLYRIKIDEGRVLLKNRELTLLPLKGIINDDTFHIQASLDNFDQLFFHKKMKGSVDAGFDQIDLGGLSPRDDKDTTSGKFLDFFLKHIDLLINVEAGKIKGRSWELNNLVMQGEWSPDTLLIRGLGCAFNQFVIQSEGALTFKQDKIESVDGTAKISAKKLELNDLMAYAENDNEGGENKHSSILQMLDVSVDISIDTLLAGEMPFSNINGKISLTPGLLKLNSFQAQMPGGKAIVNLCMKKWQEESRELTGSIDLSFDSLDIRSFLLALPSGKRKEVPSPEASKPAAADNPFQTDISLDLYADRISYDLIRADSVRVIGSISDGRTEIRKFTFGYGGGTVSLEGVLTKNVDMTVTANVISSASAVDMDSLLTSFGNFGQSFLTADSTMGKVSWAADLYFRLDEKFEPIEEDNFWKFDFTVTEAQLHNVVPVEKALSFIRQKSKENIIVSNLKFGTYYVSKVLYINNLSIDNSISDMNIFGTYVPGDTLLNLNLRLSLKDLLFKSTKKRIIETEDGVLDLGNGKDLNLKFSGTSGTHQVKLATRKEYNQDQEILEQQLNGFDQELEERLGGIKN